jgi:methenyltetrahydrofolate cyclohydrolase
MRDDTIGDFLDQLAARVPAPGGGACAALSAAQAAALLSMVARYSAGERYHEHAGTIQAVLTESEAARERAVRLAQDDAAAFAVVSDAYQLPKTTPEEQAARRTAIARALYGAAQPPAATIMAAALLVELAETLVPIGNSNVITDVAVAAELARAAACSARLNVEVNLAGLTDEAGVIDGNGRRGFRDVLAGVDELVKRAEKVTAAVREAIRR